VIRERHSAQDRNPVFNRNGTVKARARRRDSVAIIWDSWRDFGEARDQKRCVEHVRHVLF
jgi:hypothetical protein